MDIAPAWRTPAAGRCTGHASESAGHHWTGGLARLGADRQYSIDFRAPRPCKSDHSSSGKFGERVAADWRADLSILGSGIDKPQRRPGPNPAATETAGQQSPRIGADTGLGIIMFLVSVIVAGF